MRQEKLHDMSPDARDRYREERDYVRAFDRKPAPARIRVAPPRTGTRIRGAGRPRASATRSSQKSGDSGKSGSSEGDPGEPPGPSPSPPGRTSAPGSWGPRGIAIAARRDWRRWLREQSEELSRIRPMWGLA
jgi:hypothetical protein